MLFRPEKWSFEKVQKILKSKFSKGVSLWFLSKSQIFSHGYFLGKLIQKRLLFNILDRKEWFLVKKSEVLKKSKKSKFCKGVCQWFFYKNRIFCHGCFLDKPTQKRSFFYILYRKEWFLNQKSEVLKKSKKQKCSKGVSLRFLSKNQVLFGQIKPQKIVIWYSG